MNITNILAPLPLLALTAVASADLATYTLTGTASGMLNGTSFSGASVTLIGTGDTADVFDNGSGTFVIPVTATVTVAGVGSDAFVNQTFVFSNQTNMGGGFTDGGIPADILVAANAAFGTYDLSSSFGPVSGPATFNKGFTFATTAGSFQVTAAATATFEASVQAVPEPATMAALGLGALGLLKRRKKA